MTAKVYRGRLAPSPTGALHIGNMRTFLYTWLDCRIHQGELVMRMEDLGIVKLKDGAIEQVYRDLHWLGLDWDFGTGLQNIDKTIDPDEKDYIQSLQLERYQHAFEKLKKQGLIYPCSCSRKDIQMAQSAPHVENELSYPNTCRDRWQSEKEAEKHKGQEPCWRFRCPEGPTHFNDGFFGKQTSDVSQWSGDFIVAQTRERIGYQLAVVVDDTHHGISQVIRGDDLLLSTHRQIQLYKALEFQIPEFTHLPLVIGMDGKRLAKRHGDFKIQTLRELGNSPKQVLGFLAYSFGWAQWGETLDLNELLKRFNRKSITKEPFVIDEACLRYFTLSS